MLVDTLVTGAGIDTVINLPYVPEFILVGETDTDLPLTKVSISVGGSDYQNINGQSLIQADSKIDMEGLLGADVKIAQVIAVADGLIPFQTCQVRLTNAGATTPNIYAFSTSMGSRVFSKGTTTIQDNSSDVFDGFQALIFDPTNLDYVQVTWEDGTNQKMTEAELKAVFAVLNQSDANGELAGLLVLNNALNIFQSVEIYTSGGALTVLVRR